MMGGMSTYEWRRCAAVSREGRAAFLNAADAEGLEYVAGLEGGTSGDFTMGEQRDVLFRRRGSPGLVRGATAMVVLDGNFLAHVPLPGIEAEGGPPHRVDVYVCGPDEVPTVAASVDVVDGRAVEPRRDGRRALAARIQEEVARGLASFAGKLNDEEVRGRFARAAEELLRGATFADQQEIDAERRKTAAEIVCATKRSVVGFADAEKRIAELEQFAINWIETAAQHASNEEYWRGRAREAEAALADAGRAPTSPAPPSSGELVGRDEGGHR